MGTIIERRRKDGSSSFLAQISVQREGITVRENRTFERRPAAINWLKRREEELKSPGAVASAAASDPRLREVIDRYLSDIAKAPGKTKKQVLAKLKTFEIAERRCSSIGSDDLVELAQELASGGRDPSTVGNYMSHLSTIFTIARPAWKFPLDRQAMDDALVALRMLGIVGKSQHRDRRPTLKELDRLLTYFQRRERRPGAVPMSSIICFAIFSTRRESEITRLRWEHFEADAPRIMVKDMKDPGSKIGNDIWTDLGPEATTIIAHLPRNGPLLFPYHSDVVSRLFTDACKFLEIDDLHFHDLRHDGISRLFEMGKTIPQVAGYSGHKSWQSLQRYTHLRQTGDKYAGWKWLPLPIQQ